MNRTTFIILYMVVAVIALVVTVQRVVTESYGSALITGAIAVYALYRTYTVYRMQR